MLDWLCAAMAGSAAKGAAARHVRRALRGVEPPRFRFKPGDGDG